MKEPNATVTMFVERRRIVRGEIPQWIEQPPRTINVRVTKKRITECQPDGCVFDRETGNDVSRWEVRVQSSFRYRLDLSTLKMMEPQP